MQTSGHGKLLNGSMGLPDAPTLVASVTKGRPITFSHLRVDSPGHARYSMPTEAAYAIHLHLKETTSYEVREVGRVDRNECAKAGSLIFADCQSPRQILFNTPFHTIRSRVPLPALQEFAEEAGGSRQVFLRPPSSCGSDDPIIRHLLILAPYLGTTREQALPLRWPHCIGAPSPSFADICIRRHCGPVSPRRLGSVAGTACEGGYERQPRQGHIHRTVGERVWPVE
jgi:hypothetical protein